MAEGRLHPRPHRRRVLRDRGRARARQEVQARHRGGGRPPRRPRRHRARASPTASRPRSSSPRASPISTRPTRRKTRPAAERTGVAAALEKAAERQVLGHPRPRRPHHLLREIRLPGLRLHHRRDRAAAVLRSTPRRAPARPATASARSWCSTRTSSSPTTASSIKKGAVVPWAKSNPPSPYYMQVLGSLARAYDFDLDTPWDELPEEARDVILHGTGGKPVTLRFIDGRKQLRGEEAVRGRDRQSQPPHALRPRARGCARSCQVPEPRARARSATAPASSPRRWR